MERESHSSKIVVIMDIEEHQFKNVFRYGESIISSPGKYCIAYSLLGTSSVLKAHGISKMVQYGKLIANEKAELEMYIFPVDCIHGTISAVPFLVNESIENAREWLFLRPKNEWYNIYLSLINETLDSTNPNKRKLKN